MQAGFNEALARLTNLIQGGWLGLASESAYNNGFTTLIRVGPLGDVPGMSKLVEVYFRDLVVRDSNAVLTIRWEATGPSGGLFPALDADITITPDGPSASRLVLDGSYRPPLAGLGAGLDKTLLRPVAGATIRSLLTRMASAITRPELAARGAADQAVGTAPRQVEFEGWSIG